MEPLVSIVVPVYNAEGTLDRTLNSIWIQTYKNYEVIVVNDCSIDDTEFIIGIWKEKFNGKLIYRKTPYQSGSPVKPRNYGCNVARGKYIAFLDADDYWNPNKLQEQIALMEQHSIKFSYHNMRVDDGKNYILWGDMSRCHAGDVFNSLLFKNFIPCSSIIITKECYQKFGGMNSLLKISHDWELNLRIAREYLIYYMPEVLGTLVLHKYSVITKTHRRRVESRKVIRMNKKYADFNTYYKALCYYYVVEFYDIFPEFFKKIIKKIWYTRDIWRYKK